MVDLPTPLSQRDLLAVELALGLLEGSELATAMRLRLADPDFAQVVEKWEMHLAPLFDTFPGEQVPDHILSAIEAQLDQVTDEDADNVIDSSVFSRMKRWRVAAITAGTVAASLAVALLVRPDPLVIPAAPVQQVAAPQMIAQLSGEREGLSIAARYDADRNRLNVATQGIESQEGAPVLWIVPTDGTPRALGILPANDKGLIDIAPEFRSFFGAGSILAVTMEDPGSAPYEAPTTPIIASGVISKI